MVLLYFSLITLLSVTGADQLGQTGSISCPDGWRLLGSFCYLVTDSAVSGSSAGLLCEERGGRAAVIETLQEMELLKDSLLVETVYLGVNTQAIRESLIKLSLKMGDHTGFTFFYPDEPDNRGGEDCVVAASLLGFAWQDVPCSDLYPVLCKKPAEVTQRAPACAAGEHLFAGASCFWASLSPGRNITTAQEACGARRMHLASVHSQQEHDFIQGLRSNTSVWIGLNDLNEEGVYVWSDGTPQDYENWHASEPGGGASQNCVDMYGEDGGWNDAPCHYGKGVICKGTTL